MDSIKDWQLQWQAERSQDNGVAQIHWALVDMLVDFGWTVRDRRGFLVVAVLAVCATCSQEFSDRSSSKQQLNFLSTFPSVLDHPSPTVSSSDCIALCSWCTSPICNYSPFWVRWYTLTISSSSDDRIDILIFFHPLTQRQSMVSTDKVLRARSTRASMKNITTM